MIQDSMSEFVFKRDDLVSHAQCPLCGGQNLKNSESIGFHGADLHYNLCGDCELMFLNPMPTQDWYNRFYAEEFWEGKTVRKKGKHPHFWSELLTKQLTKELERAKCLYRFLSENSELPEKGSHVLEIGCAFGLVGRSIAHRINGEIFGVEPSNIAREFATTHAGIKIVARNTEELANWRPKQPVNLTIMSHVLENIAEPLKALSQIHRVLDESGLLMVEMSNPVYVETVSIQHPYVYSRLAFLHTIRRAGFSPIKYETNGRPKNAILPRFQRILARKTEQGDAILTRPSAGLVPFSLRRRLGRSFWRRSKAFKLKSELDDVDRLILDDVKSSMENEDVHDQGDVRL